MLSFMKIRPVEAELLDAEEWKDRRDEGSGHISYFAKHLKYLTIFQYVMYSVWSHITEVCVSNSRPAV
jgi:hypothetical protein